MLNTCLLSVVIPLAFAASKGRFPIPRIKKENTQIAVDDTKAAAKGGLPDEVSGVYEYYKDQSASSSEKLHFQDIQSDVRMQMPLLGIWKRREPKTPLRYLLVFAHQSGGTSVAQRLKITSFQKDSSFFGRTSVKSYTKFDTARPRSGGSHPTFTILNQSPKQPASISARESFHTPPDPDQEVDDGRSLDCVSSVHEQVLEEYEPEMEALIRERDGHSNDLKESHDLVQRMQDELATADSEIEKLKNRNKEQLATQSTFQSENEKLQSVVQLLSGQKQKLQEDLGTANQQKTRLQRHINRQQETLSRTEMEQIQKIELSEIVQVEIHEMQRIKIVMLGECLSASEDDKRELRNTIASQASSISQMEEQIKELHHSQATIKGEKDRLAQTTKHHIKLVVDANEEIQQLKHQVLALEQTLSHITNQRDELKGTLQSAIVVGSKNRVHVEAISSIALMYINLRQFIAHLQQEAAIFI